MKATFAKLKRFFISLTAFLITYVAIVGALWSLGEPVTHFKEQFLKQWLGYYWWIVIYIVPLPIALIAAVVTLRY